MGLENRALVRFLVGGGVGEMVFFLLYYGLGCGCV